MHNYIVSLHDIIIIIDRIIITYIDYCNDYNNYSAHGAFRDNA